MAGSLTGKLSPKPQLSGTLNNVTNMDYDSVRNKPTLGGVTLEGHVTLGDVGIRSVISFTSADWIRENGRYRLTIRPETHGCGMYAFIKGFERQTEEGTENAFLAYKRLSNGSHVIYSDEPFDGTIILESGVSA